MSGKVLSVNTLHTQAYGRWLEIFQAICPGVFDEAIASLGQHVTCPFHGGKDDFRFLRTSSNGRGSTAQVGVAMCTCGKFHDGFAVLKAATGASFREVLDMVDQYLNGYQDLKKAPPVKKVIIKEPSLEEMAQKRKELLSKINKLWGAAEKLSLKTALYYQERGINVSSLKGIRDIKFINNLGYYISNNGKLVKEGSFPALLGAMRAPDGELVAIHRTWLSKDGTQKAPVSSPKKLSRTPGCAGAAIRLFDATNSEVLGLTEGIETALGVRQLSNQGHWCDISEKLPVWACFSEANIRNFEVPPELKNLKRIVVFFDNDSRGTGEKAFIALKDKLSKTHPNLTIEGKGPDKVGQDWLDVAVELQLID